MFYSSKNKTGDILSRKCSLLLCILLRRICLVL